MKKLILLTLILTSVLAVQAQIDPVKWTFSAKKTGDKTYELHMTASIQTGWHLYSQTQPEDAIIEPTGFVITSNPLFTLEGKVKEVGKMEKFEDKKLQISAHQYSGKVDFVQVIKLKGNAKTNIQGVVKYQTCNDERCLPVKKVDFNVALN